MQKALIIGGIVLTAILASILAMGIGEARSLLLGLVPEEAILQLADKIDEQRITTEQIKAENDQKTEEIQSVIVDQQTKLEEQQRMIEEQDAENAKIQKTLECQALQKSSSWCGDTKYKLSLDAFLKKSREENPPAMENDDVVASAKNNWKICQEFFKEYVANGCK